MSGKFIYMGISSEYRAYHIHYHYSQELHKGLWPYNLWKSICNMKMAKKKIEDLFARRTRSPSQRGRPRHQKRRVFSDEKW